MDTKESLNISTRDRKRLRRELIGDGSLKYYEGKFATMERDHKKWSFNIAGLIFGYFWAFYRGLYGWGFLALLSFMGGFYLILLQGTEAINTWVVVGNILTLLPGITFGFFGNHLYRQALDSFIDQGLALPKSKQKKWFDEYAGGNVRIVLGLIFASVFIIVAFVLSVAT